MCKLTDSIVGEQEVIILLINPICKELGIETTANWYSKIYKSACEHEHITVVHWNQGV